MGFDTLKHAKVLPGADVITNRLSCSEVAIYRLLTAGSKHCTKYGLSPLDGFKDVLHTIYHYVNAHAQIKYSLNDYTDLFYNALTDNSAELPPEVVKWIRIYYGYSFANFAVPNKYKAAVIEGITQERQEREQLLAETGEINSILGKQPVDLTGHLDTAHKLYKRLQMKGCNEILLTIAYMLNYGYILGKRAERARRFSG